MNIGMILEKKFPPDIRVEKEADALIKTGHQVHLLAIRTNGQLIEETINGIQIHRYIPYEKCSFWRKVKNIIFIITHFSPRWTQQIQVMIKEYNLDVLHVHDLPLVGVALRAASSQEIPVIVDLHETYPEAVKVMGPKVRVIDFLGNWKQCEKKWLKMCHHIIVVIDEAKERLIEADFSADKITVVSNMTNIDFFNTLIPDQNLAKKYKNNFVILYTGGFNLNRGLDVAIKAMKEVVRQIPEAKLLLVGRQKDALGLDNLINRLSLNDNVELIDWQESAKMMNYILLSHVCLVPHRKNPFTDTTIPHKLFHYMLAKKPVIVSDCVPLGRIVDETNAGLIFKNSDSRDLAEKIIQIYKNPDSYGKNGYQAVIDKYNWENDGAKLIKLYQHIEQQLS